MVDVVGGRGAHTASRRLVGVGILAALPTVASGLSDWVDMYGSGRRIGVVHGTANSVALTLQIASWSARRRGHHVRGAALGMLGLGALTAGGYLGGVLVYTERTGVDVEVPLVESTGWKVAARESELTDGEPFGVEVEGAARGARARSRPRLRTGRDVLARRRSARRRHRAGRHDPVPVAPQPLLPR